jgi:16S rRNA (adenine1518-N6/adenine1519-N6)-dimethyltransferase
MVQKEVADKFTASSGDKAFSSLGVITKLVSHEAKTIIVVPPTSFNPPPKVDSAVIYIKKDMSKSVSVEFKKFLKGCFTQPRKKLIKNLSAFYNKNLLNDVFIELDIKETARPHEVDASLYSHIYTKVTKNGRNTNANSSSTSTN